MKWFIENNKIDKDKSRTWIIPYFSIWHDNYYFLETGIYTKAIGFEFRFLNVKYNLTIQQGY